MSQPNPTPKPETSAADSAPAVRSVFALLLIACLFTVVGGFMDGYSVTAYHVFATAQSGNVVYLATDAAAQDWPNALRHLPPIGTYILGMIIGRLLGAQTQKHTFRATLICQAMELSVLLLLVFAKTHLTASWVVPSLSFCSALQNVSFAVVGPWKINTSMTTGNIRAAVSGLVLWFLKRKPRENRGRVIVASCIVLSFTLGALLGSLNTRLNPKHALTPCIFMVTLGMSVTWRQRIKNLNSEHET